MRLPFKFLLCILILQPSTTYPKVYFVAPDGISTLSSNINLPGSLSYATTHAIAGDTVWVKAGNYGSLNISISNANTSYIGYTNVPGDIVSNAIPDSLNLFLQNTYDTIFPTLDGVDRATAGIGIDFVSTSRNNIVIKNFQIRNYRLGISIVGSNNLIENIIAYNFGDVNVFYSGTAISTYGNNNVIRNAFVLNGAAEGINAKGDSNLITHCKVYCNDTLSKHGDTDYYIYISANTGTNQAKYNVIEHCYIERISRYLPHLGHGGHGLCLTLSYNHAPCASGIGYCYDESQKLLTVEKNTIRNCTTKNIFESVMLRGDKVQNNLIEDIVSLSYGSLNVQNSSRYNTFNRCHIKNTYYYKDPKYSSIYRAPGIDLRASYYGDSTAQNIPDPEVNSYPWEIQYAASYNTFSNCIFENVASGVLFDSYAEHYYPNYHTLAGKPIDRVNRKRIVGNNFINCTFIAQESDTVSMLPVNRPSFMLAMRGSSNNSFINCIINGFYNFEGRYSALNTQQYVADIHGIIPTMNSYQNCLFHNNAFDNQIPYTDTLTTTLSPPILPGSNNVVSGYFDHCWVANPMFTDYNNKDFHLLPTSPCLNMGKTVDLIDDFEGNQRPCGKKYDIGAYEFQGDCSTTAVIDDSSIQNLRLHIYPNPARTQLNLKIPQNEIDEVSITNLFGQVLINMKYKNAIDISSLTSGMYIITVTQGQNKYTQKFIKE